MNYKLIQKRSEISFEENNGEITYEVFFILYKDGIEVDVSNFIFKYKNSLEIEEINTRKKEYIETIKKEFKESFKHDIEKQIKDILYFLNKNEIFNINSYEKIRWMKKDEGTNNVKKISFGKKIPETKDAAFLSFSNFSKELYIYSLSIGDLVVSAKKKNIDIFEELKTVPKFRLKIIM